MFCTIRAVSRLCYSCIACSLWFVLPSCAAVPPDWLVMQEARRCLDRLLKISPNCRQAISLRDVVDDKIAKGMLLVSSVCVLFIAHSLCFIHSTFCFVPLINGCVGGFVTSYSCGLRRLRVLALVLTISVFFFYYVVLSMRYMFVCSRHRRLDWCGPRWCGWRSLVGHCRGSCDWLAW